MNCDIEETTFAEQDLVTNASKRVVHLYFINWSAFRRFVVKINSFKELKAQIKSHVQRSNDLYRFRRSAFQRQTDCLLLTQMALKVHELEVD